MKTNILNLFYFLEIIRFFFRGEAFREKSDVWSFGVFMWEMFHLGSAEPYGDKKDMIDVKRLVRCKIYNFLNSNTCFKSSF